MAGKKATDNLVASSDTPVRHLVVTDSSNIHSIGYQPERHELEVVFKADLGQIYVYSKIGASTFVALATAPSVGSYFGKLIRPFPAVHPYTVKRAPSAVS